MPSLEEENRARLEKILKQARLEKRKIPDLIKNLKADIDAKKIADAAKKVSENEFDKGKLGQTIKLMKGCEDVAKFFLERKQTFSQLSVPSSALIKIPNLKPGASVDNYIAAAVVLRIFLTALNKHLKRVP